MHVTLIPIVEFQLRLEFGKLDELSLAWPNGQSTIDGVNLNIRLSYRHRCSKQVKFMNSDKTCELTLSYSDARHGILQHIIKICRIHFIDQRLTFRSESTNSSLPSSRSTVATASVGLWDVNAKGSELASGNYIACGVTHLSAK